MLNPTKRKDRSENTGGEFKHFEKPAEGIRQAFGLSYSAARIGLCRRIIFVSIWIYSFRKLLLWYPVNPSGWKFGRDS